MVYLGYVGFGLYTVEIRIGRKRFSPFGDNDSYLDAIVQVPGKDARAAVVCHMGREAEDAQGGNGLARLHGYSVVVAAWLITLVDGNQEDGTGIVHAVHPPCIR